MKLLPGSKVYVNLDISTTWGVRVLDPSWADECRQRDIAQGNTLDDAGESRMYSDVRMYDRAVDGDDLITVTSSRGKASYLSVRGVHHAPTSLVRGVTPKGRTCWFRSTDVIAVC